MEERLGMGEHFFVRMDEFTAHPERYEEFQFQNAAQAVDTALSETMKYMSAEEAGRRPVMTKEKLSDLWQTASRAVAPLDQQFAEACYYKALGWLRPEEWHDANERGIKTDLQYIRGERIKLIKSAKLQRPAQAAPTPSQWITDKEHRERLTFVGGGLAVLIGAFWTAFVYFDGKTWVSSWFKKEATYYVCIGEHKAECRSDIPWQPCGTNPTAWVKSAHPDACAYVEQTKLSDVSGNQCGYATFELKCSTRK
jgi:hypothetical protein